MDNKSKEIGPIEIDPIEISPFDIDAIEKGKAADPAIEAGDRVIVGTSAGRTAFYDFLGVVPALGVFASIATR